MPISVEDMSAVIGAEKAQKLADLSISCYSKAADYAAERGIIIADTKFEFGENSAGELILADEVLTPDSSRFWPQESYCVGSNPPSLDKQFVRDWLDSIKFNHQPPAPELPDDVVAKTREKYVEAYEKLTGQRFE
jgi:phosphoribosylaminoimidazole-succinocarboxamide synthase